LLGGAESLCNNGTKLKKTLGQREDGGSHEHSFKIVVVVEIHNLTGGYLVQANWIP